MKIGLHIVLFLLIVTSIGAQYRIGAKYLNGEKHLNGAKRNCGTPYSVAMSTHEKKVFKQYQQSKSVKDIITIPVHFIIVHRPGENIGAGSNISEERILDQLEIINTDFRALNIERANVPSEFSNADSYIEFCIASKNELGNPTNGISRFATDLDVDNFSDEILIKTQTGWNRDLYLNVWVCYNSDLLGFALIPNAGIALPDLRRDGVVVWTDVFGGREYVTNPSFDLGRTLTHEIGHYLGLQHVWGPRDNSFCTEDDGMDDTPLQNESNFGCPNHPSPSCSNDGDMFMNFMDYVDDSCMANFSQDQADFMYMILETERSSLIGLEITQCEEIIFDPPILELDAKIDLLCHDDQSGFIQVSVSGGKAPFNYLLNGIDKGQRNTYNDLSVGDYTIIVFDDLNERDTLMVRIEAPPQILLSLSQGALIQCQGDQTGSFIAAATGGFGELTYSVENIQINDPNNLFSGLTANTYVVTVRDQNECTEQASINIGEPEEISIEIIEIINSSCDDEIKSGEVEIKATGGTGDFNYEVNGVKNTTGTYTQLGAQVYSVIVEDANECGSTLDFSIGKNSSFQLQIDEIKASDCDGATGRLELSILNGSNQDINFEINGVSNSSGIFDNLEAGILEVVVSNNECIIRESITIPSIFNPIIVYPKLVEICPDATDGRIEVSIENSSDNFIFTLFPDTNLSGVFENLSANTYQIGISNAMQCDTTIEVEVAELAIMQLDIPDYEVNCNDDILTDFPYDIDTEYSLIDTENGERIFEAIPAGTYLMLDAFCESEVGRFEVKAVEGLKLAIISQLDPKCFGEMSGSIYVTAVPGNKAYNYSLNGLSNDLGYFDGLGEGKYTIDASNDFGCTESIEIELFDPEKLEFVADATPETNGSLGSISLTAQGGTAPLEYAIDDTSYQSDSVFNNLKADDYELFIKDANGCITSQFVTVDFDTAIEVTQEEKLPGFYIYNQQLHLLDAQKFRALSRIRLFDIQGRRINNWNSAYAPFDLSRINSGVYIIRFEIKSKRYSQKIFVP